MFAPTLNGCAFIVTSFSFHSGEPRSLMMRSSLLAWFYLRRLRIQRNMKTMIRTATMPTQIPIIITMLLPPSSLTSVTGSVTGVTGCSGCGYGAGSGSGAFTPPAGVQVGSIVIIPSFTIPLLCSTPWIPTHCFVGPNSYRFVTLAYPTIS